MTGEKEGDKNTDSQADEGWCVYVLRCRDESLYIGSTNNLGRRLTAHENGRGSRFVRARKPFELVKTISCATARDARQLEYRLKRLRRKAKIRALSLDESRESEPASQGNPLSPDHDRTP